jgi:hypothetical protein
VPGSGVALSRSPIADRGTSFLLAVPAPGGARKRYPYGNPPICATLRVTV